MKLCHVVNALYLKGENNGVTVVRSFIAVVNALYLKGENNG